MLRYESYSTALACDNVVITFLFFELDEKKRTPKPPPPPHYVFFFKKYAFVYVVYELKWKDDQ